MSRTCDSATTSPRDERVLLFVGKIMSPKGAFDCLEVVARLRAAGRKLRLIMIGEVHVREQDIFAARIRERGLDQAIILPRSSHRSARDIQVLSVGRFRSLPFAI